MLTQLQRETMNPQPHEPPGNRAAGAAAAAADPAFVASSTYSTNYSRSGLWGKASMLAERPPAPVLAALAWAAWRGCSLSMRCDITQLFRCGRGSWA